MSSVKIGRLAVRPVPPDVLGSVGCTNCRERPARWEFGEAASWALNYSCSSCFLYSWPVMRDQREALDGLIVQVENALRRSFVKDSEGKLSEQPDADRIAFGIVMGQRYEQMRGVRS